MARTKRPGSSPPPPPQPSEAGPSKRTKTAVSKPSRRPPPPQTPPVLAREFQPTFVSAEAERRYRESVIDKTLVYERGFDRPIERVERNITRRHWEAFTRQPGAAILAVIREFYANAREHLTERRSKVRGKWVSFDREAINNVFQLPNLPYDGLEQLRDEGPNYEAILRELATPAASWTMSRKGEYRHFPGRYLHLEGRVWHYFIGARLNPSLHFSTVSKDRALLIYSIVNGQPINVGRIIEQSIILIASGTRAMGFGHPSLIYELCLRAGVPTSAMEELQQPKPPLTPELVERLNRERPAEIAPPRRRSKKQQDAATLEDMRTRLDKMERVQRSTAREIAHLRSQMTYTVQVLGAIAAAGDVDIPVAPVFDDDSTSEEEEETETDAEDDEAAESE